MIFMDDQKSAVCVKGFRVGAIDAGIYAHFGRETRPDMALIAADGPCTAAGLFTTNQVKAAPVLICEDRLQTNADHMRAVLINAGCANACTSDQGLRSAEQTAKWVAESIGCSADEVLMMSTGVIGTQLPLDAMQSAIHKVSSNLSGDGWDAAARAIMTTDTRPKCFSATVDGITIAGIAKGAGMIAPNMATMLSLIVTDARISHQFLNRALRTAVEGSFNRIVIDGDMSTNDTVLMLASGATERWVGQEVSYEKEFLPALTSVCNSLAQAIVRDGEGVTKFIELHVQGARNVDDARQIANTIATSPLVKTAFYGGDANWGRILAAAGRAGIEIDQSKLSLWYDDLQLVANGTPLNYDESRANAIAAQPEIVVTLDLGLIGNAEAVIWTCDLSHDYVSINGHYRT
jgi:glutamate N-acetyltransferase/amino-acid N-acetyltransferase